MNLFRSMMSVNFRVNQKGETTFYFPVVAGAWRPHKGYRITSEDDLRKLKRYLEIHYWIVTAGLVPLAAILAVRLIEGIVASWMLAILLCGAAVLAVSGAVFERVFIRKVVGKYNRTEERLRFVELQRIQADSQAWKTLILAACFHWFFLGAGVYMIFSRIEAGVGILFVIIFAPFGMQLANQLALKCQGEGESARE